MKTQQINIDKETREQELELKNIFKAAILESKNYEKKMARQGCATGGGGHA